MRNCGRICCKFTSITFGVLSGIFIIVGSVLVHKYKQDDFFRPDYDFDDDGFMVNNFKLSIGITMIVFGIIFAIIAISTSGCAYCLKKKDYNTTQIYQAQPQPIPIGANRYVSSNVAPYPVQPDFYNAQPAAPPPAQPPLPYPTANPPNYDEVMMPQYMGKASMPPYVGHSAPSAPSAPVNDGINLPEKM